MVGVNERHKPTKQMQTFAESSLSTDTLTTGLPPT